ncbi:MAG: metallophosphoesterase [Kiritimatiellae bacterium]|nr:metallophosphoesterase [Kiritimatiellia bacterium]
MPKRLLTGGCFNVNVPGEQPPGSRDGAYGEAVLCRKGLRHARWLFWVAIVCLAGFSLHEGCFSSRLPQNAELTVVHLSDLHLSTRGRVMDTPWTHKIVVGGYKLHKPCTGKSFDLLEKAVAVVNGEIRPDAVIITGDIVDCGNDGEALKKGAEIIRKLNCPVVIAQGDHDKVGDRWEAVFGKRDGRTEMKGFSFFHIPFESDAGTFKRLEDGINGAQGHNRTKFLCMHRMLYTSWLMNALSKRFYGRTALLSPDREAIINMLGKTAGRWIVLCGHSHTNHEGTHGNITEFCTSSLAEYPHELRILKVKGGKVWTSVMCVDKVKDE